MRHAVTGLLLALTALPALADADLRVIAPPPPLSPQLATSPFYLHADVVNDGPDTAHNVRVTFDVAPSFDSRDVPSYCTHVQEGVVCTIAELPAGKQESPYVDGRLPDINATFSITETVSSDTSDPNPANNHFTWRRRAATTWGVGLFPVPQRADPGSRVVVNPHFSRDVELKAK